MPSNKIKILSTRPFPASSLDERDTEKFDIDILEFIKTEPIQAPELMNQINKLANQSITAIFTSMNAVEAVAALVKDKQVDWDIFSLGTATKRLAFENFKSATITGSAENAAALAEEIIATKHVRHAVFFCGDQRRDELPDILRNAGIQLKELVVYSTRQLPHHIEKSYDAIMFFSPSAVESFFLHNLPSPETTLFAIGETTAATIEQYTSNKVITSDHPGKQALLEKLISYYNTINHYE